MKAVLQRVSQAQVAVDGQIVGQIRRGLLVFLGVAQADDAQAVRYMCDKILNLRIFPDEDGKMNLSVTDVQGEIMLVSQFTLLGNTRKGRRPNFIAAAEPARAEALYAAAQAMLAHRVPVATGVFGAMMDVSLVNDGPVTLIIESP